MFKTKCCTLVGLVMVVSLVAFNAHAFKIISKKGNEVRWKNMPVKYFIGDNEPRSFKNLKYDGNGEYVPLPEIIQRSFETWRDTANTEIEISYEGMISDNEGGDDGKNIITFVNQGWHELEFDPPAGALAVTVTTYDTGSGKIVDADIFFNDQNYDWGHIDTEIENENNIIDIQNIATHEIGHLFGLAHSSESPFENNENLYTATMYYTSSAGETFRRILGMDDENALKHLYPEDNFKETVPEPDINEIYPTFGFNTGGGELKVNISGQYFGPLSMVKLTGGNLQKDQVCTVTSVSDNYIECLFDLYNVSSGEYDLVVTNTYDKKDILKKGFEVVGREIEYESSGGGCGRISETAGAKGGAVSLFGLILLIFPIIVNFYRNRLRLEVVNNKSRERN